MSQNQQHQKYTHKKPQGGSGNSHQEESEVKIPKVKDLMEDIDAILKSTKHAPPANRCGVC